MAKKKRQNKSVPRHKRMNRSQRLQSVRHWLATYKGKSIVRAYKNYFGVDRVCALLEIKFLGRPIDEAEIQRAKISAEKRRQKTTEKNLKPCLESDFHHYYIAGFTENGFSFGVTWEEAESAGLLEHEF